MDLAKQTPTQRLNLCRKYFFIGTLCLPFLWLVNVIWFFPYAFMSKYQPENIDDGGVGSDQVVEVVKGLKKWVLLSAAGTMIWTVILITWNSYFQLNRTSLDWADAWTYILPVGKV